jgi:hypothetical protein
MNKFVCISIIILLGFIVNAQDRALISLSDDQILELIDKNRPSKGGDIPPDLKYRLGATHVNGQYCFTDEPYIIEGAKKIESLGYGIIKLWFFKANGNAHGYKYNSDWNLTKTMTFKELAQHPYYKQVFDMPFKVFALNINEGFGGASTHDQSDILNSIEYEFYELTKYLLTQYKDRDIKFILENWEGDWTMRGGVSSKSKWRKDSIPADAPVRVKNMIDWVNARQEGVDRARRELGGSKCKVYNAVEVNKVFDGILDGMPTITTDVLPKVKVDMVSWSAYDGKSDDGLKMYKGIDYIRQNMNPTDYMRGEKVVFIGEINEHENANERTREYVQNFCDLMMGVYLAQKIPYIFYWELYSNEPKEGPKLQNRNYMAEELRGNWLIRPDGSFGWAQEYFNELLVKSKK